MRCSVSIALVVLTTLGCVEPTQPPSPDARVEEDGGAPAPTIESHARFDLACGHSGELWQLVIDSEGAPTSCDDRWDFTTHAIGIYLPYPLEISV